jgi:toxin-antitoxin system PIN domain toxin
MFVVDTNVLIYAADRSSPAHAVCRSMLDRWRRKGAWHLTWPIAYEFLRVVTHPRVFARPWSLPDATAFLEALFASPGLMMLSPTEAHAQVLRETVDGAPLLAGNVLHDVHTVVLMREHGVKRIYTRDADFRQFSGIEVVDPMGHG